MARRDLYQNYLMCSFCGKSQREVRKLIAGPTVYICDECIRLCTSIIQEPQNNPIGFSEEPQPLPSPHQMMHVLDQHVVGQSRAKKTLAVAVYNHYKRIGLKKNMLGETHGGAEDESVLLQKSNVLLCGPTGSGKTLLAQTLAKMLKVPFAVADATTLTEAGYVGEDVESIVCNLLVAANYDVAKAEHGIIYIDEIDKLARKSPGPSLTRDVSGEGVQQALLKIIEGTEAHITPRGMRKYASTETIKVPTHNILIICGGSFTGLTDIIAERLHKKTIGFHSETKLNMDASQYNELLRQVEPQDLSKYGLIPEFIGRLPVLATLDELNELDLERVLLEPKNALIRQYQKLFSLENVNLVFEPSATRSIAKLAYNNKIGARGLRGILENMMLELMYETMFLENLATCSIDEQVVLQSKPAKLQFKPSAAVL